MYKEKEIDVITTGNKEAFIFNYNDSQDFQHLDILFCKNERLLGRIIRFFTKSEFSHVAIVLNYNDVLFIVDSQHNGTNIKEFSVWCKRYQYEFTVVRKIYWSRENSKKNVSEKILSVMGVTGYDFASLLVKKPLYILTGKWFGKRNEKALKRMYCSEFVAYAFGVRQYWKQSPGSLFDYMKKNALYKVLNK